MNLDKASLPKAIGYGIASAVLFIAIFAYSNELVEFARRTRQGEKLFFLVPIAIAFLVSYVHGTFTSYFWDTLGLKAAKRNTNTKSG